MMRCGERGMTPGARERGMTPGARERGMTRNARERGMTLVELIVAFTILAMLASMSLPLASYKVRRNQERELRAALREIHKAIDDYKDAALAGKIEVKLGTEGYPETLEQLVEGVKLPAIGGRQEIKFLRRIPIDPMTGKARGGDCAACRTIPSRQSWGQGQSVFFGIHQEFREGRGMAHLMRSGKNRWPRARLSFDCGGATHRQRSIAAAAATR